MTKTLSGLLKFFRDMFNSRIASKQYLESLDLILSDQARFRQYTEERFFQINENERQRSPKARHEAAKKNNSLNRYYNIVPYDSNRITLTDERLGSKNKYINASRIVAPYGIPNIYIATQGPLEDTVMDFWRMVVEAETQIIICLTPQSENGREKCARYWPVGNEVLECSNEQADMRVTNVKREIKDAESNSIVRSISVEFYDKSTKALIKRQRVTQLHFLGWPDHGVPAETDNVINLILLYRHFRRKDKPTIVHCSAGCGRTGTFCVIDCAEALLSQERDIETDPIFALTDEFRKQRTTMVQAQSQYAFCYRALSDFIRRVQQDKEQLE